MGAYNYNKGSIMKNYLYNHVNEETAYTVQDYPWGYRMRTEQRYWIESNKNGDRFVYQTKDPRTGKWCAPKKSVYNLAKVLVLDENNHVKISRPNNYDNEDLKRFLETHQGKLNEWQVKNINEKILSNKKWEGVEFEIVSKKTVIYG